LASTAYLGNAASVAVHGGMIVLKSATCHRRNPTPPRSTRGEIASYSDESRRRLIRTIASVDHTILSTAMFATLTFHRPLADHSAWTALHNWIRAIRHRYPSMMYLWRMELQARGAVHFHVVLWLPIRYDTIMRSRRMPRWMSAVWHRVADPESRPHTIHGAKCELVRDGRRLSRYVAKYMVKDAITKSGIIGRRWGISRNLPRSPVMNIELTTPQYYIIRRALRRWIEHRAKRKAWVKPYLWRSSTSYIYIDVLDALRLLTACGITCPTMSTDEAGHCTGWIV